VNQQPFPLRHSRVKLYMKDAQYFATKPVIIDEEQSPANPALARAVSRLVYTGSLLAPVDTNNKRITPLERLPKLPNPGNKEAVNKIGNLKVSYPLRFQFMAVEQRRRRKQAHHDLLHITVNLSAKTTDSLLQSTRAPASAYADKINRRLNRSLLSKPDFFLVMEVSKDQTLHVHIVMTLPSEQRAAVRDALMKDTNQHPTDVRIDTHYKNYLNIERDSPEWVLHQVDLDMDETRYINFETAGRHAGSYYELRAVDMGLADYLSKDLGKRSLLGSKARRYYAPQCITKAANDLYRQAYELQQHQGD
jgi:hypothetical protein